MLILQTYNGRKGKRDTTVNTNKDPEERL